MVLKLSEKMRAVATAVATFAVVSGGIVGVGLAFAPSAEAQVQATSHSGDWTGGYISSNGQDVNQFQVKLRQSGAVVSGTITEVNALVGGDRTVLFLTSDFAGTARGGDVQFTKTYDGSGGVGHSVTYKGRLDQTGRRIRGTFDAGGNTGTFEMVR